MRCLRKICNIRWQDRIANTTVLEMYGTMSIYTLLVKSQLCWVGHVRMEDSRIPKVLFYGQLKDSTRREGRPLRYKDTLKYNIKHCGLNLSSWEVDALNRPFWRSHCNGGSKEYEKHCMLTANLK